MSDIMIDNQLLSDKCTSYIELYESIEQEFTALEDSSETALLLQRGNLCTKQVLCELQILKVQRALSIKVTEKQVAVLRNKFIQIIGIYQGLFIEKIPCSLYEVTERIKQINPKYEEDWLRDIYMLGVALALFVNQTKNKSSYPLSLECQYRFTGIFRNSILCKNLNPRLGADNHICYVRRKQLMVFHSYADDQIAKHRMLFARTESLSSLERAIRINRSLIELAFITNNKFFDTEFYKKQDEAMTKILISKRDSQNK